MRRSTRRRQSWWLISVSVIAAAGAIVANVMIATTAAANYDVRTRRIPRLKPGAVVEDRAPEGWSHLILKNQPHLDHREAQKVHPIAAHLTGALFSVLVAHVDQDPLDPERRFRLRALAAGLGTLWAERPCVLVFVRHYG